MNCPIIPRTNVTLKSLDNTYLINIISPQIWIGYREETKWYIKVTNLKEGNSFIGTYTVKHDQEKQFSNIDIVHYFYYCLVITEEEDKMKLSFGSRLPEIILEKTDSVILINI